MQIKLCLYRGIFIKMLSVDDGSFFVFNKNSRLKWNSMKTVWYLVVKKLCVRYGARAPPIPQHAARANANAKGNTTEKRG